MADTKVIPNMPKITSIPGLNSSSGFVSQWKTNNTGYSNSNQIMLPLVASGTYDFIVNWGDETSSHITAWNDPAVTHTYPTAGTYTVQITGTITGWMFDGTWDCLKILNISNWGPLRLGNVGSYFYGCTNLTITAADLLDISGMTTFHEFFGYCSSLTTIPRMNEWDVSNITVMSIMFCDATLLNQDITAWDVSNVTVMSQMFCNATAFNPNIGLWDTSSLQLMDRMFEGDTAFNQNIGSWNTSNVIDMSQSFYNASIFNQDLSLWNVSKVRTMDWILVGAALSTINYDAMLIAWSAQAVQSSVWFRAGNSKYTAGGAAEAGRTHLISTHSWSITDGGSV
jgi:surface protein